jgi:hypothetical protein
VKPRTSAVALGVTDDALSRLDGLRPPEREGGHRAAPRDRGLGLRVAGGILAEGRILRAGDGGGDVRTVQQDLRLRLVDLRLPEGDRRGQPGDEDRGADDVPLPPTEDTDVLDQAALLRGSDGGRVQRQLAQAVTPRGVIFERGGYGRACAPVDRL